MASSSEIYEEEHVKKSKKKYEPGCDALPENIFDFPFLAEDESHLCVQSHGRIMFLIRGPPGTAKSSLSSYIKDKYESAVKCSADDYFELGFVSKLRNKESLKASHKYCKKKVIEECEFNSHPIIVQNTHMRKFEIKPYIECANQFGYTIIMAVTLRKFDVSPETLEKTNRKGLNKDYFRNRLAQWEEYYPLYLGWFLGVDDSLFLLNEGKEVLAALIADGKFCKAFDVYSEENIWQYYRAKCKLSCYATHVGSNRQNMEFYLSDTVQDAYGKCFPLKIRGYIITKESFVAIVKIPKIAKPLVKESRQKKNYSKEDALCEAFFNLDIQDPIHDDQITNFMEEFEFENKTAEVTKYVKPKTLNIHYLSFIVLAQNNNCFYHENVKPFLKSIFKTKIDSNGNIDISELSELDDGTQYLRLPNDTWFAIPNKNITINAVFSGRYT